MEKEVIKLEKEYDLVKGGETMEFLPKNGLIHAYAFSTGGLKLTTAGDNKEANAMLNEVLEALQLQNYELIDVKMSTTIGALGQTNIRFMILYK
ncbi:hypothetical protein LAHI110946_02180 [Lactococcus hircilactis]